MLMLGAQVIYCFFMVYFIVKMGLNMRASGLRAFMKQPWNVIELIIAIASIIAVAMYIMKKLIVSVILDDLNANPGMEQVYLEKLM